MTVTTTRISADEFLAGDYPIGSELIDGVVHVNDSTFLHNRMCSRCYDAARDWTRTEHGGGEVRSPKTWHLDIGAKRREYRRSGTKELWPVDTPARMVFVYRAGESLDDALELGPGEQLTSPLLPGFTLAIDDLFAG